MAVAIRVENLGKKYRVVQGTPRAGYRTLRESLIAAAAAPFRRLCGRFTRDDPAEDFWALKDVSFEVQPGEVVGIVGRNGSGKSTLLKILSRITKPTTGRAEIHGRVGSLLEVGTGFHPELTGRENVYLNGSILGMTRKEIDRRYDEIVAFADVERFLDTPVKRYSSGMYVRLAFAVAAHLEPEILVVDEVLAVGDAAFQKKCLGKMHDAARNGRTVLFVSHNMAALLNLCTTGILISHGEVCAVDCMRNIARTYLDEQMATEAFDVNLTAHPARLRGAIPIIERVRLLDQDGKIITTLLSGQTLIVELHLNPERAFDTPQLGVGFNDQFGQRVFTVGTYYSRHDIRQIGPNSVVRCTIAALPLAPGSYTLTLAAGPAGESTRDWLQHAVTVVVGESDYFQSGQAYGPTHGPILVSSKWTM